MRTNNGRRLTSDERRGILDALGGSETYFEIAKRFDTTQATVSRIARASGATRRSPLRKEATIGEGLCRACGQQIKRRAESPAQYAQRQTCNITCYRLLMQSRAAQRDRELQRFMSDW